MTDKKDTDKPLAKEAAAPKDTAKKASAVSTKKAAAKKEAATVAKSTATKDTAATRVTASAKAASAATAATAKAAASKESDMKHAAQKISEIDKETANNSIKSRKSVEDLKARAHEAKQRAQKKILDEAYVSDKPTDPLERLANTFDSSAKRWEMVVYPSLFAFVLLAGYGFFLIYRLTHDIAVLSQSVTHMAVIVSDVMPRMSNDLTKMTGSIDNMTGNISGMSVDIGGMTTEISSMSGQMNSLTPMSKNIQSMTHNIGSMNRSVYGMQRDMHGMNRTVSSGPFGMMNDVMPFTSDTNVPPPIQPQPVWPSYNPVPVPQYGYSNPYARPQITPWSKAKTTPQAVSKAKPVKQAADKKKMTQKNPAQKNGTQNVLKTKVDMPGASPLSLKEPTIKGQ
ncbi:MAG: hypothetical protein GQ572_06290 [Gammaproteobacteria bacterium]|nr:hypothetical protein [Gammaproteobacteria bacterium]